MHLQYLQYYPAEEVQSNSCRREGWGSVEATEMVLNNLFYITAKVINRYRCFFVHFATNNPSYNPCVHEIFNGSSYRRTLSERFSKTQNVGRLKSGGVLLLLSISKTTLSISDKYNEIRCENNYNNLYYETAYLQVPIIIILS